MTASAAIHATAVAPVRRYLTLAAARALDCNGCGDCCNSSRTDGFWTWGALPQGQYAHLTLGLAGGLGGGGPLIIPLERTTEGSVEGSVEGWRDRAWRATDATAATSTPFRCTAFRPQADGRGLCGIHDRERPSQCGEFPVHTPGLEDDIAARGVLHLETSAFPRCTWYRVDVVALDVPALDARRGCVDSDGYVALGALPPSLLGRWPALPPAARG